MALKLLGTREQKENKSGNTGTKAQFREQGNTRRILLGTGNMGA